MNEQIPIVPQGIPMPPPVSESPEIVPNKKKRDISKAEKRLLLVALAIAVLFDRFMFEPLWNDSDSVQIFSGVFWLCYLLFFYLFYWKKIAGNRVLWFVTGCGAALCVWNFFFPHHGGNLEYRLLTYLVIPAVFMAHAQFAAGNYHLKDVGKIALAWLCGWAIKPFSGIPAFFEATGSLALGENKSTARKAALGFGITLPLLGVIIPLLCGADRMFGYYVKQLANGWNLGSLVFHIVVVALAFALFYSFLWNIGLNAAEKERNDFKAEFRVDELICYIVLGSICFLYVIFCIVQFTYLFAGAGLPDGMTYSEYAREGFAQTVAVCMINLLIFGLFLQFGKKQKAVIGFVSLLLGLTCVMLVSGAVRLKLYIDAYGLTWLRLLSAWFMIYLAAVIVICAIRMVREKLPAIALCGLILLGWYTLLGYSNPDAQIARYNHNYHSDMEEEVS